MSKEEFMRRAIELSREGMLSGNGGPFGTVIVKNSKIVGEAYNRVLSTNDPTAHAEVLAIREASQKLGTFDLSGCELCVIGLPCAMCLASMLWAKIDRLYYVLKPEDAAEIGFDDRHVYEEVAKPVDIRKLPAIEMRQLHGEARAVYDLWKNRADKTTYAV